MKKIVSILLCIILISAVFGINDVYADGKKEDKKKETTDVTDPTSVISSMEDVKDNMASTDNSIADIINTAIGLLQITGTGISIIVVSILGIKYLLASPSEKADTKKSILPIIIGCALLFGAVNLISAISNFANNVFSSD